MGLIWEIFYKLFACIVTFSKKSKLSQYLNFFIYTTPFFKKLTKIRHILSFLELFRWKEMSSYLLIFISKVGLISSQKSQIFQPSILGLDVINIISKQTVKKKFLLD
ncbi:hypothetical protein DPV86_06180 [Haemophilus parahaemolyticus]|nr:hypothetical protein DPV86_06180 [Haemophilus parahaemolyticus]